MNRRRCMRSGPLKPQKAAQKAFTLIEVLVVVAIIALLIAILLPSLKEAQYQAKTVACRANLHDLGLAIMMYADAYRSYYPVTAGSGKDSFYSLGHRGQSPDGHWQSRYLRNLSVLICPATRNRIRRETLSYPVRYDQFREGDAGSLVDIPYMGLSGSEKDRSDIDKTAGFRDDDSGGMSYEYNSCYDAALRDPVTGSRVHSLSGHHKRTSHFRFVPAQMVLVHDNDNSVGTSLTTDPEMGCNPSHWNSGNNCPQPWDNHGNRGMNVMFGDGHADFLKKLPGTYINFTDPGRPIRNSLNASIDRVFLRSQYPWEYSIRR